MVLKEKIEEILQIPPNIDRYNHKRGESYNSFGREEKLLEKLAIRVSLDFKKHLMELPHWAEIVRIILEDELDSGQFFLRRPQTKKRGRGGDLIGRSGADEQILIKVDQNFKERITAIPRWQAKAREALYEKVPVASIQYKKRESDRPPCNAAAKP